MSRFAGPDVETDNAQPLDSSRRWSALPLFQAARRSWSRATPPAARVGATDATASRGSSAIVDGVRWVANLEAVTDGQGEDRRIIPDAACLRVVKSNYGLYPEPLYLRRDAEHNGALTPTTRAGALGRNGASATDRQLIDPALTGIGRPSDFRRKTS